MIVKKFKRTSFKKSKSTMIGGLVDYILASHDDEGRDKLAFAGSKNFLTTTVAAQKREMIFRRSSYLLYQQKNIYIKVY